MYHHERSARPLTPRQLECGTMVWVDERLDFQYRAILVHHLIVALTEGNIDAPTGLLLYQSAVKHSPLVRV